MKVLGENSLAVKIALGLNVVWVVVWFALLLSLGMMVFPGVLADLLAPVTPGVELSGGLRLAFDPTLVSEGFTKGLFFTMGVMSLPMLAIGLVILDQLRKLFHAFGQGDPWNGANSRRVQVIGLATLGLSLVSPLTSFLLSRFLASNVIVPGVQFGTFIKPEINTFFLGLVLLVLAEVFAMGTRIKEEQDLTV